MKMVQICQRFNIIVITVVIIITIITSCINSMLVELDASVAMVTAGAFFFAIATLRLNPCDKNPNPNCKPARSV